MPPCDQSYVIAAVQPFPFFHQHSALDLNLTVDMFYILQSSSLYTGLVVLVQQLSVDLWKSTNAQIPEKWTQAAANTGSRTLY